MTHTETLKPCPFCGGGEFIEKGGYRISCSNCPTTMRTVHDAKELYSHWNNRPIEDTLTKRVAELEELMREMDEYLDTHKETTICNGSILHTKIKQALKKGENDE